MSEATDAIVRLRPETWAAILERAKPVFGDTGDAVVRKALGLEPLNRRGPQGARAGRSPGTQETNR